MNNLKTHIDASASKEKLEFKKSQKKSQLKQINNYKGLRSPYIEGKLFLRNKSSAAVKDSHGIKSTITPPVDNARISKASLQNYQFTKQIKKKVPRAIGKTTTNFSLHGELLNQDDSTLRKHREIRTSVHDDIENFEEQLRILQTIDILEAITGYFKILDEIIGKSYIFGRVLQSVRSGILRWKEVTDKYARDFSNLERQNAEQESVITALNAEKKHLHSENTHRSGEVIKDEKLDNPLYKFIPESNCNLFLAEKQDFIEKIQKLESELKVQQVKEVKYEKLISALKNRGYPVEEVYSKDVMWFETESLLKPSTPVRRSSSMGKNPFDLSSSSSITDDNNI